MHGVAEIEIEVVVGRIGIAERGPAMAIVDKVEVRSGIAGEESVTDERIGIEVVGKSVDVAIVPDKRNEVVVVVDERTVVICGIAVVERRGLAKKGVGLEQKGDRIVGQGKGDEGIAGRVLTIFVGQEDGQKVLDVLTPPPIVLGVLSVVVCSHGCTVVVVTGAVVGVF